MGDIRTTAKILTAAAGVAQHEAGEIMDAEMERQRDENRRALVKFGFQPFTPQAGALVQSGQSRG